MNVVFSHTVEKNTQVYFISVNKHASAILTLRLSEHLKIPSICETFHKDETEMHEQQWHLFLEPSSIKEAIVMNEI